jgi:hypothetical protein
MPSVKRSSSAIEVPGTPNPPKRSRRTTGAVIKEEEADELPSLKPSKKAQRTAGAVAKVEEADYAPNPLEEAIQAKDCEIPDLKAQIAELHEYMINADLLTSKCFC